MTTSRVATWDQGVLGGTGWVRFHAETINGISREWECTTDNCDFCHAYNEENVK